MQLFCFFRPAALTESVHMQMRQIYHAAVLLLESTRRAEASESPGYEPYSFSLLIIPVPNGPTLQIKGPWGNGSGICRVWLTSFGFHSKPRARVCG
jgi:hypothetical protein